MAIKESNYSKSVSSYVIREEHQNTDKGRVYERDITTIGGRNYTDKYKRPVYRSSNFIITASNESVNPMPATETVWDKTPEGGEEWKWDDVEDISQEEDSSASITLKPDVYSLKSFAYFGSCSELLRVSINNITSKFPGELYVTDQQLRYLHKDADNTEGEYRILGCEYIKNEETGEMEPDLNTALVVVDNPFYVNLHSKYVDGFNLSRHPLKYFLADEFYKTGYMAICDDDAGNTYNITNVEYEAVDGCVKSYSLGGNLTITLKQVKDPTITKVLEFSMWLLLDNDYVYLTKEENKGWHIRPIPEYYDDYKKKLSMFENVLLSEHTLPKYSPSLEVYTEADFGYTVQLQQFTFPIGDGGYNLGINTMNFSSYVEKLSKIAALYDENFCDNLWRSMTHEAIKNFDWSYQRDVNDKLTSINVFGGNKIQKLIRIIGREFDDIKLYIDGIKQANRLTYDDSNNIPDYFLTDYLENEGWDYKNVIPFDEDFNIYTNSVNPYPYPHTEGENVRYENTDICEGKRYELESVKTFSNEGLEYTPYDINNHFIKMLSLNSRSIWKKKGCASAIESILSLFGLKRKKWVEDINEEHSKFDETYMMSCPDSTDNAKSACPNREKFPIVGDYDYEVYEYSYQGIKKELSERDRDVFLYINNNKFVAYGEDAYIDRKPTPWRGLLVKEEINETDESGNVTSSTLYPWFDKTKENDGNPYYQMYGGWLQKEVSVGDDNDFIQKELYTETIPNVRGVRTIKELLQLPPSLLNDGDICYVSDLSGKYIIIDGIPYDLKDYIVGDQTIDGWYYVETNVYGGSITLGNQVYSDSLSIIEPTVVWDETEHKYVLKTEEKIVTEVNDSETKETIISVPVLTTVPIEGYEEGSTIRIYVRESEEEISPGKKHMVLEDKYGVQPTSALFVSPKTLGANIKQENLECADKLNCPQSEEEGNDNSEGNPDNEVETIVQNNAEEPSEDKIDTPTNYFKLNNKFFSRQLQIVNAGSNYQGLGWVQLAKDSDDYKYAKSLKKYYNGNNPHKHEVESDSGQEYLNYFIQLFRHSIENNLFDYYDLYYKIINDHQDRFESQSDLIDAISEFGFDGLGNTCTLDESSKKMDYKLWITRKDEDGNYWLNFPEVDEKNRGFVFDNDGKIVFSEENRSETVINTKFVDIVFKCKKDELTPKLKYLDKVVIPYLSQVLPSSLIVRIKYDDKL